MPFIWQRVTTKPFHCHWFTKYVKKVAVVGAGIIGSCTAWSLAQKGYQVDLFDKDTPMAHTSQSSSKLLHGGLRYLETGQFKLVHKALQARHFWLQQAPHLCQKLELLFPIYQGEGRPRWQIGVGTKLYDVLARGSDFPHSQWLTAAETLRRSPHLKAQNLLGSYSFYDAQMDDYQLGQWVVAKIQSLGGTIHTQRPVNHLSELNGYDAIVNATGPWVMSLRSQQSQPPAIQIDWVRGSHIFIDQQLTQALMLPIPNEKRIFFVLPYHGKTMIGTTEIRQDKPEAEAASETEINYLLAAYNHYHQQAITRTDVCDTFSGVRPLLKDAINPSNSTREWAFETVDNVLHVYGGKWTTAQIQGEAACEELLKCLN